MGLVLTFNLYGRLNLCCILNVAVAQEREVEGDVFLCDIGQGLGFRPGSFDGAIR